MSNAASSSLPAPTAPGEGARKRDFAITVAVVALGSLAVWTTPPMLPLRLLVTLVHEAGHALMAMLLGGTVQSVTINPSEGGLTFFSLPAGRSTFRLIAVGSAGYVGTAIAGGVLLELCSRVSRARIALGSLAVLVAAIGLAWVPLSTGPSGVAASATGSSSGDGRFTIFFCVAVILVLVAVAVQPHVRIRRIVLVAIATALCLGAVEDLRLVLSLSRTGGHSDATIVSEAAFLPPWFWATLWLLLGVAACGLGLWSALGGRGRKT